MTRGTSRGWTRGAPLPALWAKTSYLVTSSDPTLGAVNGEDGLPDLAIGRLPATTVEEAEALVQKVLEWEDTAQSLGGKAILVADNPDIAGSGRLFSLPRPPTPRPESCRSCWPSITSSVIRAC